MATIVELVPPVVQYLVQVAREGGFTTYGEVARAVGTHPRVVPKVVEVVKEACLAEGWPPLMVLVLQAGRKGPSLSCLGPWLGEEAPQGEEQAVVAGFVQRVYGFDWTPLLERYPVQAEPGE